MSCWLPPVVWVVARRFWRGWCAQAVLVLLEGRSVWAEPFGGQGVEGAVFFGGGDGPVEFVLQLAVVLADTDTRAGAERHLWAERASLPPCSLMLSLANPRSTSAASASPFRTARMASGTNGYSTSVAPDWDT